ncbi:hypothetical protein AB0O34_19655 [Sphaerisporangium sp. NPDC088356]|uniref:hypothetical protein n=1 Tax=Sphaerisporangium sp. NPDC088356 TaxID=3154871 RepID=UPI003445A4B7
MTDTCTESDRNREQAWRQVTEHEAARGKTEAVPDAAPAARTVLAGHSATGSSG